MLAAKLCLASFLCLLRVDTLLALSTCVPLYMPKLAVNLNSSFESWLDNNSIVLPILISRGEVATSLIEHHSLPDHQFKKTLFEIVESKNGFNLLYPPSVIECAVCLANSMNKSCGKCPLCGAGITRRHLTKPKEKIKFNLDPDTFSLIPHEYFFVVGRHTGGKTMDTSHRLRCEASYYK